MHVHMHHCSCVCMRCVYVCVPHIGVSNLCRAKCGLLLDPLSNGGAPLKFPGLPLSNFRIPLKFSGPPLKFLAPLKFAEPVLSDFRLL